MVPTSTYSAMYCFPLASARSRIRLLSISSFLICRSAAVFVVELYYAEHQQMAEENIEAPDMSEVGDMPENLHPLETEGAENDFGGGGENKWPGWPGENVFRMLVPVQKVGGIIGRKGEYIKKICEETKARIKILDGPPGTTERTVLANISQISIAKVASN
ncbi:unnamed protein product [Ilex paraguariensis]|uniref:K Homology domain-containing protein n=1 Tax=Ilex paraguariensis TaxID=185542 RepID=A0ABC8RG78_9AQUA